MGLDLFYTSGFTRGLPAMIPIAMLYGTPEDCGRRDRLPESSAAIPISYVEMGEEPDGQYMLPGGLRRALSAVRHRAAPRGPGPQARRTRVFEGVNEDIQVWPDAAGQDLLAGRFLDYLKAHGRLGDLAFMSFEHYPYEPCKIQWSSLYDEPALISHIMEVWRDDGLPAATSASS